MRFDPTIYDDAPHLRGILCAFENVQAELTVTIYGPLVENERDRDDRVDLHAFGATTVMSPPSWWPSLDPEVLSDFLKRRGYRVVFP